MRTGIVVAALAAAIGVVLLLGAGDRTGPNPFIVYVLLEQVESPQIPYGVAALIAVAAVVLVGLGMERVVVRPLMNAPRITLLVATIAFALLAIGVEIMLFLPEAKTLPALLSPLNEAGDPRGPELFNYIIEPQLLLIVGVLVGLAVGIGYFFSKTDPDGE